MTPSECRICGGGWVRPACAAWCPAVRAWLAAQEPSAPGQRVDTAPSHGTVSSYREHRCRCGPCKVACAAYMRAYRARKKAAAA